MGGGLLWCTAHVSACNQFGALLCDMYDCGIQFTRVLQYNLYSYAFERKSSSQLCEKSSLELSKVATVSKHTWSDIENTVEEREMHLRKLSIMSLSRKVLMSIVRI